MSTHIRIAVDAMSGDLGPRVVISACQNILKQIPDVDIWLIGDESLPAIMPHTFADRLHFIHAAKVISMSDNPLQAIRHKKDSSMGKALECLRDGKVDACVSAGNTGALITLSLHLIERFDSIDRVAICKLMPTKQNVTAMLDLGGNTQATPQQLLQFALMGRELVRAQGVGNPDIALLNIGVEAHKGTENLQQAQNLFSTVFEQDYSGFIEANQLFDGTVNVIVTDGFTGNIALKASEGVARFIGQKIKQNFAKNIWAKFSAFLALPVLSRLKNELNPASYNGAVFLGLKKVVVKSHGDADEVGFTQAIRLAYEQARGQVPAQIQRQLELINTSFPFNNQK